MPKATVDINETIRHELTSCPGGYVVLRRLSYGEFLQRREMVGKMRVHGAKWEEGEIAMANKLVTAYEFKNCIVDHNLEDDNGNTLDFKKEFTLQSLDPRVGEEIGKYIDELHNPEKPTEGSPEGTDRGNSESGSGQA